MTRYFMMIGCLLLSLSVSAQMGEIHFRDSLNNSRISAVTVVIVPKNLVIYTGSASKCVLPVNSHSDTLFISRHGFETISIPVASIGSNTVRLTPHKLSSSQSSRNIELRRKSWLNGFDRSKVYYYVGLQKAVEKFHYLQIAQKFTLDTPFAMLSEVSIARLVIPYGDLEKDISKTSFKIRIYDLDTLSGGPGADLYSREVEVMDSTAAKVITTDVKDRKIYIPGKVFFIGVEWVRTPYNTQITRMDGEGETFNVDHYKSDFKKIYQPFIGMSNVQGTTCNTWALDFRGTWSPYTHFYPELTDFAISAEVLQ